MFRTGTTPRNVIHIPDSDDLFLKLHQPTTATKMYYLSYFLKESGAYTLSACTDITNKTPILRTKAVTLTKVEMIRTFTATLDLCEHRN